MKCVVGGAGGFIGHHLVKRLKADGHTVIGVDIKRPEFEKSAADTFNIWDLRGANSSAFFEGVDEVYQLAANMGGAGYLFTGEHDAEVMRDSVQINLSVLEACRRYRVPRVFFSSSACVYETLPTVMQTTIGKDLKTGLDIYEQTPVQIKDACSESDAYPANPDSEYGWEKLFSERLYQAYARNYGQVVRIGRYHNVFGPLGTWKGGREKFPAAVCRKVAEAPHGTSIELWGSGRQQRSFTYIDDAVEGTIRVMRSDLEGPFNIGSSRMVSIEEVARQMIAISQKWLDIKYIDGPVGVQGRNSDNTLILDRLFWEPRYPLEMGLHNTYQWVRQQVAKARGEALTDGVPVM